MLHGLGRPCFVGVYYVLKIPTSLISYAHTRALTKVFLEILIFEYFGYLRLGFDEFFGTDSESSRVM